MIGSGDSWTEISLIRRLSRNLARQSFWFITHLFFLEKLFMIHLSYIYLLCIHVNKYYHYYYQGWDETWEWRGRIYHHFCRRIDIFFLSNRMEYDRGDSFSVEFEPNRISLCLKSKRKLLLRSYSNQLFERKWKSIFLWALCDVWKNAIHVLKQKKSTELFC